VKNFVTCPVCGEANPSDRQYCKKCRNRLRPLIAGLPTPEASSQFGSSAGANPAGGEESSVPEWLRQARQEALESNEDRASGPQPEKRSAGRAEDLLAGLDSQSQTTPDETPAWVARITGKVPAAPTPVARQPFGELDSANEDEPLPDAPNTGAPFEKDELSAWFEEASGSEIKPRAAATSEGRADDGSAALDGSPAKDDEIFDWLRHLDASAGQAGGSGAAEPTMGSDVPDWVKDLGAVAAVPVEAEPAIPEDTIPDWLKNSEADEVREASQPSADVGTAAQAPDWSASEMPHAAVSKVEEGAKPAAMSPEPQ
jgi:hypothetical protein